MPAHIGLEMSRSPDSAQSLNVSRSYQIDVFAEMGDDVVDRFGVIGHRHQFQADVGVFAGVALP